MVCLQLINPTLLCVDFLDSGEVASVYATFQQFTHHPINFFWIIQKPDVCFIWRIVIRTRGSAKGETLPNGRPAEAVGLAEKTHKSP